MKKAFDTIDHELLLAKLELHGFRGPILHLIQNYLQNRNQSLFHQDKNTSLSTVTTGVPQGSFLGPFLFLLCINDLPDCIPESSCALFADNTSLYNFGHKAKDKICNNVKIATSWSKDNKLIINNDKCESLSFGTNEFFPFEAFGAEIRSQSHCKYFRFIWMLNSLSKKHIEHVTKKLINFCGIVHRILDRFSQKSLIPFYYAFAINYGSPLKTNLEPIGEAKKFPGYFLQTTMGHPTRYLHKT